MSCPALNGAGLFTLSKHHVIASQRARWRGNPFSKCYVFIGHLEIGGAFQETDSRGRFAPLE